MPAFSAIKNGLKEFGAKFTSGKQNISKDIFDTSVDNELNSTSSIIKSLEEIEEPSSVTALKDLQHEYDNIDDGLFEMMNTYETNIPTTKSFNNDIAEESALDALPRSDYDSVRYRDAVSEMEAAQNAAENLRYTSPKERMDNPVLRVMRGYKDRSGTSSVSSLSEATFLSDDEASVILNEVADAQKQTGASFTSGKQATYSGEKSFINSVGETVNIGGAKRYAFKRQQRQVNNLEEQINKAGENTDISALEQSLKQERQKLEAMQQDPTQIRTRPSDFIMGNPKLITGAVGATVTGGLVLELARSNGSLSNEQLYGQAPLQNDYY